MDNMLKLKVRPLTASEIGFLRRWDAEEDDVWKELLRLTGRSPVYVRNFGCVHCGWPADEYLTVSSPRLWLWSCNCWNAYCHGAKINFVPFTAWTGWNIEGRYIVPLTRKPHARMARLDIIVPEELGGEVVWRRGITTFKTIMQGGAASLRDVQRLGRLQTLRSMVAADAYTNV
jgi:hypothetical protein